MIKVNGIGPKAALSVLSYLSVQKIYQAVHYKDFQQFVLVPGIGNKTAQKIILYLHDKLEPILEGMQFDQPGDFDAQTSIQSIPIDASDDLEDKLRLALKYFSK